MLGLLFLPAASHRVAQFVLCGLMIGSAGGKDFVRNNEKSQARQNSRIHLVSATQHHAFVSNAYDRNSKPLQSPPALKFMSVEM